MRHILSLIVLVAFVNLLVFEAFGQALQSPAMAAEKTEKLAQSTQKKKSQNLEKKYAGEDSLLAAFAVPPADIEVLENALGDMTNDGVVNIIDLLRIRDIASGNSIPQSEYEKHEGDLNADGSIDFTDLEMLRDVLLRKVGLPYMIDNNGGQVVGNDGRTTFTIPPGAYDETKRMCVENYTIEEFASDLSSPISDWDGQDAFLAGAKLVILNPTSNDKELPPGIGLMEMVAPGMEVDTTSNNSVYNLAPDADGDGVPELRLLGDLEYRSVSNTSSTNVGPISEKTSRPSAAFMVFGPNEPLTLTGYQRVVLDTSNQTWLPKSTSTFESGMHLALFGLGWQSIFRSDIELGIVDGTDTSYVSIADFLTEDARTYKKIKGIVAMVPWVDSPKGMQFFVRSSLDNSISNALVVPVEPPSGTIVPGMRDTILVQLAILDTLYAEMINDPKVQELATAYQVDLVGFLSEFRDSVASFAAIPEPNLDLARLAAGVKLFENMQLEEIYYSSPPNSTVLKSQFNPCEECKKVHRKWTEVVEICTDINIGVCFVCLFLPPPCLAACPSIAVVCRIWKRVNDWNYKKCTVGCCPKDVSDTGNNAVSDGNFEGRVDNKIICLHPGCFPVAGSLGGGPPIAGRRAALKSSSTGASVIMPANSPDLSGIIVKVNNSPIPVSMGVTDRTGKFFIPFNIISGEVSLSAYDPRTGLFDNNIGSVIVGDPLNEIHTFFGADFDPDTSKVTDNLLIGKWTERVVSNNEPRHEFNVSIPPSTIGNPLNLGFRSEQPLTFWLQDPAGNFITKDSSSTCNNVYQFVPNESGNYLITVTYGISGGEGPFAVGVSRFPDPPTPYLCGKIPYDTLFSSFSPYISANPGTIPVDSTLTVEAGMTIKFQQGGSITAEGILQGTVTPSEPIILKPENGSNQQIFRPSNNAMNERKDGWR